MKITIKRISNPTDATLGVLLLDSIPFCVTLEDSWRDNKRQISCIPAGDYVCKRVNSPKFGEVFQVQDVPNRTHILFHAGNTEHDTSGCILLGTSFGTINTDPAVLQSARALVRFMERLRGIDEFPLKVINCF
jgi:hypothetical protein